MDDAVLLLETRPVTVRQGAHSLCAAGKRGHGLLQVPCGPPPPPWPPLSLFCPTRRGGYRERVKQLRSSSMLGPPTPPAAVRTPRRPVLFFTMICTRTCSPASPCPPTRLYESIRGGRDGSVRWRHVWCNISDNVSLRLFSAILGSLRRPRVHFSSARSTTEVKSALLLLCLLV